jgi:hypothetical protein
MRLLADGDGYLLLNENLLGQVKTRCVNEH